VTSLERSATGKLFHATGPLTAKLLSPSVVRVRIALEKPCNRRMTFKVIQGN